MSSVKSQSLISTWFQVNTLCKTISNVLSFSCEDSKETRMRVFVERLNILSVMIPQILLVSISAFGNDLSEEEVRMFEASRKSIEDLQNDLTSYVRSMSQDVNIIPKMKVVPVEDNSYLRNNSANCPNCGKQHDFSDADESDMSEEEMITGDFRSFGIPPGPPVAPLVKKELSLKSDIKLEKPEKLENPISLQYVKSDRVAVSSGKDLGVTSSVQLKEVKLHEEPKSHEELKESKDLKKDLEQSDEPEELNEQDELEETKNFEEPQILKVINADP